MTGEQLRELIHYDQDNGVFKWRTPRQGRRVGAVAGSGHSDGYLVVRIAYRQYLCHRLAWLYVHDVCPTNQIDHIHGVRADNRIANLRDVSVSVNAQNQKRAQKDSATGLLGVSISRRYFRAAIKVNGKILKLGTYTTAELAHSAYLDAKRDMHEGCTI